MTLRFLNLTWTGTPPFSDIRAEWDEVIIEETIRLKFSEAVEIEYPRMWIEVDEEAQRQACALHEQEMRERAEQREHARRL